MIILIMEFNKKVDIIFMKNSFKNLKIKDVGFWALDWLKNC